jgi:hypothetical protein
MVSWPKLGTRVTVRYRRPAGSVPPLTDAVGQLLQLDPLVRVQTKTGSIVAFAPGDVVAVRELSGAPVRNSQIRALEHAAASACPGAEQHWLDGWLLRAARGGGMGANSAVPLSVCASASAIPAIAGWYEQRGLTPRLSVPDRLVRLPGAGEHPNKMLVRDVRAGDPDPSVQVAARPDDAWLQLYPGEAPIEVLTAVVDGELAFGLRADTAAARAAVTDAPDGTRWVGLSAVGRADRQLCEALLAWGAARGATRGWVRVPDDDPATGFVESLGFATHHHSRYLRPAGLPISSVHDVPLGA